MPHEMTEHDQMYSVREAPWHLGSGMRRTLSQRLE